MMFVLLAGCGDDSSNHQGQVKTPSGSSYQEGRDYKEVVAEFEEKGFQNIKTEKIEDLITGWITSDGEVEHVTVGGDIDYSSDEWVEEDIEVVISYHTFEEEDDAVDNQEEVEDEGTDTAEEKEEPSTEIQAEVLTAENNKELENVLGVVYESDPIIKEFADKYAGQVIEFDAHTAYVNKHGDYDTRFDYLIMVGDYTESEPPGPNFQFRDVNYYDLHLEGDDIPDPFGIGIDIRVKAEVGEYEEKSNLFQLKPISINIR